MSVRGKALYTTFCVRYVFQAFNLQTIEALI